MHSFFHTGCGKRLSSVDPANNVNSLLIDSNVWAARSCGWDIQRRAALVVGGSAKDHGLEARDLEFGPVYERSAEKLRLMILAFFQYCNRQIADILGHGVCDTSDDVCVLTNEAGGGKPPRITGWKPVSPCVWIGRSGRLSVRRRKGTPARRVPHAWLGTNRRPR